ncbi:fatty-acyl-CoA synthase [Rhizocola hellebori]|uniref:Fatty-acyl-CoA synthase n=1 Tax=Rhizocola hellebori TaxID=1392758 RepID=A0A8J3VJM3_9ACTN|nr:fatty acyl-AMP ligase [Rhizocola hellebori]GIH08845.1 fatty-acyl-CoA synthase [Rhizocola hellebori]
MSRFVEAVAATAARSPQGMVTGEPQQPLTRSWAQLHRLARRLASGLAAAGLQPGHAVAVLAGQPAEVAPVAQAIWLAGASLTMLHQPTPRTDLTVWRDDTVRVLRMIEAEVVLIGAPFEPMADVLQAEGIKHLMIADIDGEDDFLIVDVDEGSTALLQLTSGSTAEPKAVRISHGNLYANLTDAAAHLECDFTRDTMVSWLPLFHDMGMVGCLLLPMFSGINLVAITPTDFLTQPLLWAQLMDRYRGTITTAPNFAWAILTRQLERAEPQSLDLSSMRVTANGAEPIDPATMAAFVAAAARFGLRPEAVNCCYGAAESTLVISMASLAEPMRLDEVSAQDLETGRRAVPAAPGAPAVRRFPLLGSPFPTVRARVVDDDGLVLGERQVGRIQLRGASVTEGYLTEAGFVRAVDEHGWLDIGDEGYLADGQIVVCGRRKDVIIMAGRNIYPTDIERAAAAVPGVREGNVAAVRLLAGDGVARESFSVLVESRQAGDAAAEAAIVQAVTARVIAEVDARPARVIVLPPGSLPKTPSGKLRRAAAGALANP